MRRTGVLSTLAVSLLALALLAWVAEQPGRALRAPASLNERGDAAIGSGYTVQAVTADRPRLAASARRAEGRTIALTPAPTVVYGPGLGASWIGVVDGSTTTIPPTGFGLSRRAPPSPLSG